MEIWKHILAALEKGNRICLLCVVDSNGSSPGRQGFMQFVTDDHEMWGSIGGGVMEQKLVDLAMHLLAVGETQPLLKHQVHRTNIEVNKSGMICSGEQRIAFYFIDRTYLEIIRNILHTDSNGKTILLNENSISLLSHTEIVTKYDFTLADEKHWKFQIRIGLINTIYIIGGGHVSLALSRVMFQLGFRVEVFDNRPELNTLEKNIFANKKLLIDYEDVGEFIPEGPASFVVIMTTGYRTDAIVLKKIVSKQFRYLGMLGSKEKVAKLFQDVISEGTLKNDIKKVHSPVGLEIFSHTPEEIAISIAAEIIRIKNQPLNG